MPPVNVEVVELPDGWYLISYTLPITAKDSYGVDSFYSHIDLAVEQDYGPEIVEECGIIGTGRTLEIRGDGVLAKHKRVARPFGQPLAT